MSKNNIKLSNGNKYNINDCRVYKNILTIVFDEEVDYESFVEDASSLFSSVEILNSFDYVCSSHEGYNTIYKQENNKFYLSNDGSVYVPTIVTPGEFEDPFEMNYEEIKLFKLNELNNACKKGIEEGVYIDINGVTEHFTYKESDDQANIDDLFSMVMSTGLSVPYHCSDGGECKLYTPEQIVQLYIAVKTNKMHHLTYCNQIKLYMNTLTTKEEVSSLQYGVDLTGSYLETYNMAMNQAKLLIDATIANASANSVIV